MNSNFEAIKKDLDETLRKLKDEKYFLSSFDDALFERVRKNLFMTFKELKKRKPAPTPELIELEQAINVLNITSNTLKISMVYFSKEQLIELSCLISMLTINYVYTSVHNSQYSKKI